MSAHAYMPLYIDDYEAATAHLTLEEDGVYNRLLRLAWRTPGCSLPTDHAWIARKVRMSIDDFERVAKPVLEEFFTVQRGRYIQKRQRREYDDITRKKTARKNAGKLGGDAKARKTKDNGPSNATDLPEDTRAFPEPEPEPYTPPNPLKGVEAGEGAGRRRKAPARTIPADFPDAEAIEALMARVRDAGADVDARYEAERFRNHAQSAGRLCVDWSAAFRNWGAKAIKDAPKRAPLLTVASRAPEDPWPRRLSTFRQNGYWNDTDWGPRPGRPGCRAPADVDQPRRASQ